MPEEDYTGKFVLTPQFAGVGSMESIMKTESLKSLLDACFTAKHIVETLPELPKGMKPRHVHVLGAVSEVYEKQKECMVSDVSSLMNITMPSVTKLIQELEAMGMVEKYKDSQDKRVILLRLTEKGSACVKKYMTEFHKKWAENLGGISDEQAQQAVEMIRLLERTMPGR